MNIPLLLKLFCRSPFTLRLMLLEMLLKDRPVTPVSWVQLPPLPHPKFIQRPRLGDDAAGTYHLISDYPATLLVASAQ